MTVKLPHLFGGKSGLTLSRLWLWGAETHAQLAERFGRGPDAIHQFSSRNGEEIATRKAGLQAELNAESAAPWVSDKVEILRSYQSMLDRLRSKLIDPGLDDRTRSRFNRDAKALLHDCSELGGLLRQHVDITANAELPAVGTMWGPITDAQVAS